MIETHGPDEGRGHIHVRLSAILATACKTLRIWTSGGDAE